MGQGLITGPVVQTGHLRGSQGLADPSRILWHSLRTTCWGLQVGVDKRPNLVYEIKVHSFPLVGVRARPAQQELPKQSRHGQGLKSRGGFEVEMRTDL